MADINLSKDASLGAIIKKGTRELRPMQHVTRALAVLKDAGMVPSKTSTADNPLVTLMCDLAPLGESEVVAIARTMAYMENFNAMIQEKASTIKVSNGFETIAARFDSIREDSANMVKRAEKGRRGITGWANEKYMLMRRGTVAERFQGIADDARKVFKETEGQLRLERGMTDGYKLMRVGIKEAQLMAGGLRNKARDQLEESQTVLRTAQLAVDEATEEEIRSIAELDRDHAMSTYQSADRRFQTAEDIYNGLSVAYATGDVVVARLAQTTDAKERVLRQSVAFFSTNQSTLTALGVSLTGIEGLNAASRTLGAIKKGTEDALHSLREVGTKVQEDALREGYGATISVDAVKQLLDSVISYQERSHTIISEMRNTASENAEELNRVVEEGKAKLVELVHRQATEATLPSVRRVGNGDEAIAHEKADTTLGLVDGFDQRKTMEKRLNDAVQVNSF